LPDGILAYKKIQLWANLGAPTNREFLYILWPFGIFYDYLVNAGVVVI
jgi:hypothetical protein